MLEFGKTYPIIRLFFNSTAADSLVASVDDGQLSNETSFSSVTFYGDGETKYNGHRPNALYPVFWLEFTNAELFPDPTDDNGLIIGNHKE